MLQERQQFHLEQLRAAELRQRQLAAQQLLNEGKLTMPTIVTVQSNQQQPLVNNIQISTATPTLAPSSSMPSPTNQSTAAIQAATVESSATTHNIQRPPSQPSQEITS